MDQYDAIPQSFQVEFPGPFTHHDVVVEGHQVPHLRATPLDGGEVHLNLDRRIGVTLTAQEAEKVIPFIADAIAVAAGYTCHPDAEDDEPNRRHPFPRVQGLVLDS